MTMNLVLILEDLLQVFASFLIILWFLRSLKKQVIVSRSSAEAEYRALAHVSSEIIWITHFLQDLQIISSTPALIFCDN